ncbi:MAG: ABC transporter ATP-binding protein [Firmicutes bacterium]|nr:ABC transporter ATP-binding protein [Alicyclobacillaceae bacterium]MCL6496350.1 ABC transporter ATP-binding protein [Bacillota bacterium]
MLTVQDVWAGYGPSTVLQGVSLTLEPGTVVALVGANGAGKSTVLKTLSGLLRPQRGRIAVDGRELTGRPPADWVRAGVAHVPEGRQVFANLTVADNLLLGAFSALARLGPRQRQERVEEVLAIFPDLGPKLGVLAGSLSGGQQQMLAIGRGLMSQPRYLLLDEPSLGLAPQVTETIFAVIGRLRDRGVGILLVEQNGRLALAVADRAHLLEKGVITVSGTGAELLANQTVVERYLGVGSPLDDGPRPQALAERLRRALGR